MLFAFPAEQVPDGAIGAPHHLTWALVFALVPILMVWDRYPDRDSWVMLSAALAALFDFLAVWPYYPPLGASITLVACLGLLAAALYHLVREYQGRDWWPYLPLVAVALLALVALDDALDHAFRFGTPVDWLWNQYVYPALPST